MKPASTKPYLIRALHEWCTDHGFTPYVAVHADARVRVPRESVRDGQIVLNVSYEATGGLKIDNDTISFQARFGGVARDILFPVGNVLAIYARENGVGMSFELEAESESVSTEGASAEAAHAAADSSGSVDPAPSGGRPKLQRVK